MWMGSRCFEGAGDCRMAGTARRYQRKGRKEVGKQEIPRTEASWPGGDGPYLHIRHCTIFQCVSVYIDISNPSRTSRYLRQSLLWLATTRSSKSTPPSTTCRQISQRRAAACPLPIEHFTRTKRAHIHSKVAQIFLKISRYFSHNVSESNRHDRTWMGINDTSQNRKPQSSKHCKS
jgi:hypothetical protein